MTSDSIPSVPTPAQMRAALAEFESLLSIGTPEVDFQRLFAANPYILSRSLPLQISPSQIAPLGRPGRSEPDFIFYPKDNDPLPQYGVIELKRPDSRILTRPRKGIALLTREAQTAAQQARHYGTELLRSPRATAQGALYLGNRLNLFVIMGMSAELTDQVAHDVLADQLAQQLPANCRLIPYDVLLTLYQQSIPPRLHLLVPNSAAISPDSDVMQVTFCENGHLNSALAKLCRVCRGHLAPMVAHPRTPIRYGHLAMPDGTQVSIDGDVLVGRTPTVIRVDRAGMTPSRPILVRVDDEEHRVSRNHAVFERQTDTWSVTVRDLESSNGTVVVSGSESTRLEAGSAVQLAHGDQVVLADRLRIRFELN